MQSTVQASISLISQLISNFSRVPQKLLKYFNSTFTWTYFVLP